MIDRRGQEVAVRPVPATVVQEARSEGGGRRQVSRVFTVDRQDPARFLVLTMTPGCSGFTSPLSRNGVADALFLNLFSAENAVSPRTFALSRGQYT
jgi:hypothetical protein